MRRNRWFEDSLLERAGFEPSVPNHGAWALSRRLCRFLLMMTGPHAGVINLSALAICAMASPCYVAIEVGILTR